MDLGIITFSSIDIIYFITCFIIGHINTPSWF